MKGSLSTLTYATNRQPWPLLLTSYEVKDKKSISFCHFPPSLTGPKILNELFNLSVSSSMQWEWKLAHQNCNKYWIKNHRTRIRCFTYFHFLALYYPMWLFLKKPGIFTLKTSILNYHSWQIINRSVAFLLNINIFKTSLFSFENPVANGRITKQMKPDNWWTIWKNKIKEYFITYHIPK